MRRRCCLTLKRVYPRVYGGTHRSPSDAKLNPGLSPRVRGNLERYEDMDKTKRSIPACTGEPEYPRPRQGQDRVYPRVYGGTP